jgi:hypothetical protein
MTFAIAASAEDHATVSGEFRSAVYTRQTKRAV